MRGGAGKGWNNMGNMNTVLTIGYTYTYKAFVPTDMQMFEFDVVVREILEDDFYMVQPIAGHGLRKVHRTGLYD